MANDPKNPEIGELTIDASELSPFIVDLPPGALVGRVPERKGFDEVLAEVSANQPLFGDKAGITAADFATLQQTTDRIALIDKYAPAARKLVEMLEETRYHLDDQRQRQVNAIAKSVELRAKAQRNPELLARYEKTRRYRSAIAAKAVRTRLRNQAAEADADSGTGSADDITE